MEQTLVLTQNMTQEEWLNWRKKGIGGSDVGAICGVNKYKSAIQLWMEKTDLLKAEEAGEAAYWGQVMEPIIKNEFTKRTGLSVYEKRAILKHSDYPFMLANIDGFIYDPIKGKCLFEAKTASAYLLEEWETKIPESYQLQVQHYLAVTGMTGAYIAVLIGGNAFKWYFIERDDEMIKMLILIEKEFWQHVEMKTPPSIDGSQATTELLNKLYPIGEGNKEVILPKDAAELIDQYESCHIHLKTIETKRDEAANKLKDLLKTSEIGLLGKRKVIWKTITANKLDTKRLKEDNPNLFNQYSVENSYRRFSVR